MDECLSIFRLPWFEKAMKWKHGNRWNERFDERMDLLAKLLALYPFTDTKELEKEFGLGEATIKHLANHYGVKKYSKTRSEINKKNGDNPRSRATLWLCKNKEYKLLTNNKKENDD